MTAALQLEPDFDYEESQEIEIPLGLHGKQSYAFFTPATEILYGGAAGGGKSHFFRVIAIYFCMLIPHLQVYLFRRKYPDLIKNHMVGVTSFPVMLKPLVDAKLCKINYSKNVIEFWNGAMIHLCHCQYDKDMYNYQGAEIHLLLMDELTHFSEAVYRYLRGRCRIVGSLEFPDLPNMPNMRSMFPRIVCGTNPGGVGHNWVKATFIDIQPPFGLMKMRKKEGGRIRQYIPALVKDNPSLDEEEYLTTLAGLGNESLVKAMSEGDWDIVAGGMFDDVWSRKTHVIPPFVIPPTWRIDRSFDWGSSKPFSVGWWAESDGSPVKLPNGRVKTYPRGTLFRIGEWYGWNGKPNQGIRLTSKEIAKGIIERETMMGLRGRVRPGAADSSIFDVNDGHCIADDMKLCGVTWIPADKSPGSRIRGWEKTRAMMKASLTKLDKDGFPIPQEEPGMYIFERCTQFIRTIPTLPRDEKYPDDVDTDAEDHIGDETRYRVYTKRKTGGLAPVRGA